MGIINWIGFGGILIDLIIVSIIISTTYIGYRRGLVGVIFKILVFIISLLVVFVLYKPISNTIINNTQLDENFSNLIQESLSNTSLANNELIDPSTSKLSTGVVNLINSFIKDALNQTTENTVTYVALQLARFIIRVGTMLVIFISSKFLLLIVRFAAEILVSLPIIKTFNKSGGLIYGFLKGLLIIYLTLAIFSVFSPIISSWGIISAINDSFIASKMYNYNIIINLITK